MFVENKVALVTGACSGIGLCIAREFLKNGAKGVTIADVDVRQGEAVLQCFKQEFGENRAIFIETDVTKKKDIEDAMKKTVAAFKQFDILVNNAGIWNDSIWEKEIHVNLNGTIQASILAMEEYLPKYRSTAEGVIINIASIYGLEGASVSPVYNATKHGVVGFSKCISMQQHYDATKVKVVTICPGHTITPLQQNAERKMINSRCSKLVKELQNDPNLPLQKPEVISKALMPILNCCKNGSFWVIDGGKVCEVALPEIKQLKILQTLQI